MKLISQQKALESLAVIRADLRSIISNLYETKAKSCLTCEVKGACCLDEHFVNVHISRIEAVAIKDAIARFDEEKQKEIYDRIETAIERYGLTTAGDTFAQTYACPLFEKETGCLVHNTAKPLPCITHACYESPADLPPDDLLNAAETNVQNLNRRTYGQPTQMLPIPLAINSSAETRV